MNRSILLCGLFIASFAQANTSSSYDVETIAVPKGQTLHVTGLDVDPEGNVYCATRYGDVWIYNNKGEWAQFAEGLQEPCGLLVDDDGSVVVTQKPEMTRLVDTNNDGVADKYLTLSNAFDFHNNYHEYNYGGVKDRDGNYVGTLNLAAGPRVPGLKMGAMTSAGGYRGWAYKVTPKGEFIPFANGMRSPAGIGKNGEGELFYTDNQGDYVGTSQLNHLQEGKFYNHPLSLLEKGFSAEKLKGMEDEAFDAMRTLPVVWIPQAELANSPGNPEWNATKGKFGPFDDQFFIGDQTRSNVFRATLQKVGGRYQGCVIDFLSGFQSGAIRLKFDQKGALWIGETGRGWAARGAKLYGLQKVTWNGKMPFEILDVKLVKEGFRVSFTQKISFDSLVDSEINLSRWWYQYHRIYGSPKVGEKSVPIHNMEILPDQQTLMIRCNVVKEQVYCLDLSSVLNIEGNALGNVKAYYTVVNLVD